MIASMPFARTRRSTARRFAWLLWLGLLLPVAQIAAATHALSHASQAGSHDESHPQAPHLVHCDLCLMAAAIGGAAPAAIPSTLPMVSFEESHPGDVADTPLANATVLAYRSRAPPLAS